MQLSIGNMFMLAAIPAAIAFCAVLPMVRLGRTEDEKSEQLQTKP